MKKTKLLTAVLFLAGVLMTGNRTAPLAAGGATKLPDSSIQVNYEYETMEITAGSNKAIYFAESPTALNWEEVPIVGGKAIFDISWVKPSTTTRLYLKGDVDSIVTARYIEAEENLTCTFVGDLSAADVVDIATWRTTYAQYKNFSNETGYLLFFIKKNGVGTAYFNLADIEWKKGDTGNWRDFSELNLTQMRAKGGNLLFRIKAVNDTATQKGKRFSSTVKLSLQKIAAGPVVTVNSSSMTASLKNGMEYSLNKKDWFLIPVYEKKATSDALRVPVKSFDVLPTTNVRASAIAVPLLMNIAANQRFDATFVSAHASDYQTVLDDGGNVAGVKLFVRTAASTKKAASKVTELVIPFAGGTPDLTNDVELTYQQTKTGTSGIALTNKTTSAAPVDYQYAIVADPDNMTAEELSLVTWSSLKTGKTVKVGSTKAVPGMYVIFRVASSGKDSLPSEFVKYPYPIQYDKVSYAAFSSTALYPGSVFSAVTSNNAIYGDITYTWEKCATQNGTYTTITSGVGYAASQYTIADSDVGYYIRVKISNTSENGEASEVISRSSGKITSAPAGKP